MKERFLMTIKHFIVLLGLLFTLLGCKSNSTEDPINPIDETETPTPLKYEYQLHMSNYQDIIEIRTTPLTIENEQNRIEFKVILKSPEEVALAIVIDFKVTTTSKIFPDGTPNTKNYKIEFSGTKEYVYIVPYSIFLEFKSLEITNISGFLKSNQDYGPRNPIDESTRYRASLKSEVEAVLHEDLMKLNIYQTIQINSPYYYQSVITATNIDLESFYYSSMVNLTDGSIITKENEKYHIYRFFTQEYKPYLQLVGVMDDISTVETDSSPVFDFSETWFYAYRDGVYKIEAKLGEIIRLAIDDETVIAQLFSQEDLSLKVNMEVIVTEERVTFKIMYTMSQTDVKIITYYNPGRADRVDISNATKVPMNAPYFITTYTDITQPLTNQLYVSEVPNYYLVHLDGGAYVFQNPNDMTLEFFDTNLNPVSLTKDPRYNFQTRVKNVYNFEAGDYFVKVSYPGVRTFEYTLQLLALDEVYKTVIDIENPIEIADTAFEVEIEGYYDYVLTTFNANEEGLLYLASETPFKGKVYTIESDGSIKDNRAIVKDHGILIFLFPGENRILFENSYNTEKVTFTPDAHGVRSQRDDILPESFQNEFLVSRPYEDVYLKFQITEPSMVNFERIKDPVFGEATTGNYQIWMENKYGVLELKQSFSMMDSKELYFPVGNYAIRVMGLTSIKLKGTVTQTTPITQVTAEITMLNQITSYDSNPKAFQKKYDQYPYETLTIDFTLTETAHLLIGAETYLSYILLDSNNKTLNYKLQSGNQIFVLNAGTYHIFIEKNEQLRMNEVYLALLNITDPVVLADDNFNNPNNIAEIEFMVEYTFTKSYKADSEIVTFTLNQASKIRISTSTQIFFVILDGQNKTITSGYQTKEFNLEAGTYTVLINYMYDMGVGNNLKFEINYL